ncbi:MAG: copper amine oxidase N-terminal domain-containing protein, partial [Actinomycetota bacterium]|nr:copper amine oxidase N-terminal domain-containing protein [Actinomycetota bacterium]
MNIRNKIRPLLAILVFIIFLTSCSSQVNISSRNKIKNANIDIFIDGEKLETNLTPKFINDVLSVPASEIYSALGAEVIWDKDNSSMEVYKDNMTVCMYEDASYATLNNSIIMLDAPLKVIDDEMFVPYTFIDESLDYKITSNEETGDIQIYTDPASFNELPKHETDFSVAPSDMRFHEQYAQSSGFVRPGIKIEILFKIFKNPASSVGGGKAEITFDGYHIDTIPFFINKGSSFTTISRDYRIPLNRYPGLSEEDVKNGAFSVEILPDYMTNDSNPANNKAEITLQIKGCERKTSDMLSDYILDSIRARFEIGNNMAEPGHYVSLLSYIKGKGPKTILDFNVDGELIYENFFIASSLENAKSDSRGFFVPYDYAGLLNYVAQIDNGQYKILPVPVAPFEYVAFDGCISWIPVTSTLNYRPGENIRLNAILMRENKNDFVGPLRAYFLVNGELSPPLRVEPRSGTTPYLGDIESYLYKVPEDAPDSLDVKLLIDPGGLFFEHNKADNIASVTIPRQIEGESGNNVSVSDDDLRIAPSYILPGDWIQLICTVKNNAAVKPGKDLHVLFKVNGEIIPNGDFRIPASYLKPGQTYTPSRMWKVPDGFNGDIAFTVEID